MNRFASLHPDAAHVVAEMFVLMEKCLISGTTDGVATVLGRPPRSFEDYVVRTAATLAQRPHHLRPQPADLQAADRRPRAERLGPALRVERREPLTSGNGRFLLGLTGVSMGEAGPRAGLSTNPETKGRWPMTFPATMRALQQTTLDGPQDMHLITDAPVPRPGPDEVLVRVTAAGVNFADISRAHGTFADGPQPPYLAGFEAAGEIVAVGAAVTGPSEGTRVVGVGDGAFAEYMVLPAAAAMPVPHGWTDQQALGLVVNAPTALGALKPLGGVASGQTVLIHAAAGATGQIAVTLAKHFGATVIATASSGKHDTVRALGADHVLDSRSGVIDAEVRQLTGGAGADVVLESAGGATFEASLAAAKRVTGRVVVYGVAGGDATISNWDLVYKHQVHVIGFNLGVLIRSAPHLFGEVMGELFTLVASGVLAPGRPIAFDLAEGPKVLAELEARTTIGKLALLP